ncbi:Hypothetical protein SRAE_2000063000 [Strongyloides ratti]|uniref:Uncharacterized protein n=1 Tax=Strongyloides ratti TaxID=34506 RepID=A0A090L827_STRRB|nr:Hypothetical protein SRAE_2000063000 [Strongyloides ratti]CEF65956.1 Hypothetical protein SRAE_2000063000 [Strongyloides ratti]
MEKMEEDSNRVEEVQRIRKAEDTLEIDQPKLKKTKGDEDCMVTESTEPIHYIKHKYNGSSFKIPIKVNDTDCTIVNLGKHKYQKSSTEEIAAIYLQLAAKRKVKL